MSNFQNRLLTKVGALCRQVFDARVALAREGSRVSEKAKEDVYVLLLDYDRLCALSPFPEEYAVDQTPLEQLREALEDTEGDPMANEEILLNWVRGIAPAPEASFVENRLPPPVVISPINQRMLDATARLRAAIDASRGRLLTSDPYDFKSYRAARNDFTLSRAAYDKSLTDGRVTANVEDASRVERKLIPAIVAADGAGFPNTIQAAADFMRDRIFVVA